MGNLAEMSDKEKVEFLLEALEDAAETFRRCGFPLTCKRYINYVREMRGEPKEVSHG